jgi:hypothetical protein
VGRGDRIGVLAKKQQVEKSDKIAVRLLFFLRFLAALLDSAYGGLYIEKTVSLLLSFSAHFTKESSG